VIYSCRAIPGPATETATSVNSIDRDSAQHYVWGEVCDGWHLLQRPELSVIAERVPPGAHEQRHRHQHARQFFYILCGRAVMEFDGRRVELGAGQGLEIPPGTPHRFRNDSDADVHFLVISHPSTRGDRVEA
jgi:mannose-6-phosphate isomerase-like protein (cupin superfamily)